MYSFAEQAYIWLSLTPNMTPTRRAKLLECYEGEMEMLYTRYMQYKEQVAQLLGQEMADRMQSVLDEHKVGKEIDALEAMGATAVTMASAAYPHSLFDLAQPPLVLYCKGDLSYLQSNNLAVVGTRAITRYGKDVTENFVADLCTNGFVIVSGLARGVDTVAHRTALRYERPTVGVMPCGLDKVYPAENKDLFAQVAQTGLLVSEYPLGTAVQQFTFIERNRIISALSRGVLVTEAGEHSGACITVNHALEQGRDVFVVPGNIYSKASVGSNNLLKSMQGALVTTSYDILEYYHVAVDQGPVSAMQLDVVESQIIEALEQGDKHIEELIQLTSLTVSQLTPILTKLELIGMLRRLSGNYFGI